MTDLELKSHPYSSNKSKVGTNDSANPTRDNPNNPNNDRNNSSDTTQQDHGRKWEPTQRSAGNRSLIFTKTLKYSIYESKKNYFGPLQEIFIEIEIGQQ